MKKETIIQVIIIVVLTIVLISLVYKIFNIRKGNNVYFGEYIKQGNVQIQDCHQHHKNDKKTERFQHHEQGNQNMRR